MFKLNNLRVDTVGYLKNWQSYIFLALFFILFNVWIIPATISIRYICLLIGALLTGFFVVKDVSFARGISRNISLIAVVFFFVWVIFHYFYLTENKTIGLMELEKIHKRAIWGAIFAVGLAYVLIKSPFNISKLVVLLTLSGPAIVYFFIAVFARDNVWWSYTIPGKFYIPKYIFVFFLVFSYSWMAYFVYELIRKNSKLVSMFFPLFVMGITFYDFFELHAKNGFLYLVTISFGLFATILFKHSVYIKKYLIYLLIILLVGLSFSIKHIQEQPTWRYLLEDTLVALQTDKLSNWKYKHGQTELLEKVDDRKINSSTYVRIAWFKEGLKLVHKYPLGYGLVQDSFKYLALKEWPDSELTHTHSGWLDLTLGLGVPGAFLLICAIVVAFLRCLKSTNFYAKGGIVILPIITFVFLTSEVCESLSFEFFIFIIVFFATATCVIPPKESQIKS